MHWGYRCLQKKVDYKSQPIVGGRHDEADTSFAVRFVGLETSIVVLEKYPIARGQCPLDLWAVDRPIVDPELMESIK